MAKKKLLDLVDEVLHPFMEKEGYELYHSEFLKEGKDWFLRLYIEKAPAEPGEWPGLVTTDDCEAVSRYLSRSLDEMDPIEQAYYLEVSSPGMDRLLLKEEHYKRYLGELVDVKLYESINGRKNMTARLYGYNETHLDVVDEAGTVVHLPREKVSKVRLTVVF